MNDTDVAAHRARKGISIFGGWVPNKRQALLGLAVGGVAWAAYLVGLGWLRGVWRR
jgi:hypothetical protein